jgi:VCBS repeat-containing protein
VQVSAVDGGSGPDKLSFDYAKIWVETTEQKPDGSIGVTESFGFDLLANTPAPVSGKPDLKPPTQNIAPDAVDDAAVAQAGAVLSVGQPGVLANDVDADGDALTVSAVAGNAANVSEPLAGIYGTLLLNANGSYSYTAGDLNGAPMGLHVQDSFSYTVDDAYGGIDTASLNILLNRAPVVQLDAAGLKRGTQFTVGAAGGVLGNDADADGDALTVASIIGGTLGAPVSGDYGSLTLNADGSYTYVSTVPLGDATVAWDVFAYQVADGYGGLVTSYLQVAIYEGNQTYMQGGDGDDVLVIPGKGKAPPGNGKSILAGLGGDDVLIGGNGKDVLAGGSDDNVLSGGRGADTFVFDVFSTGRNVITDFQRHVDEVELIDIDVVAMTEANGSTTLDLSTGGTIVLAGITGVADWELLT